MTPAHAIAAVWFLCGIALGVTVAVLVTSC